MAEYNSERPRESLNNLTPEEYRLMAKARTYQKVRGTKTGALTKTFQETLKDIDDMPVIRRRRLRYDFLKNSG